MSQTLSDTIEAALTLTEPRAWMLPGSHFELLDTPLGTVDVVLLDRHGAQVARLTKAQGGHFAGGQDFGTVQITSAVSQTIRFMIGGGDVGSRRVTGSVSLTSGASVMLSASPSVQKTVTNADGQLLAANAARKYLWIENLDPSGSIYVQIGAAATLAAGKKIGPGGFWEPGGLTTLELRAIGDLASNANVRVIEGV